MKMIGQQAEWCPRPSRGASRGAWGGDSAHRRFCMLLYYSNKRDEDTIGRGITTMSRPVFISFFSFFPPKSLPWGRVGERFYFFSIMSVSPMTSAPMMKDE